MTGKRYSAALAALLLLIAGVGPAVGAVAVDAGEGVQHSHDAPGGADWNETKAADSAYASENGDVVLVYDYEDRQREANVTGHVGTNLSAGLAHMRFTNSDVETNVTGNATLWASPDSISAEGALSAPRPDALESLDVDAHAVTNATVAESSMDLTSTVELPDDVGFASLLMSVRTQGTTTNSAERLASNGSVSVETAVPFIPENQHHLVLTEEDGGYTLSVEQSYPVQSGAGQWDSRSAAKATLEDEFCSGGDAVECAVTLDSYAYADDRLDIAYTVTLDGVDTKVSRAIQMGLSRPDANVSEELATQLAGHVENVTLDRVEADLSIASGDGRLAWNVSLSGADDLQLAYADLLEVFQRSATGGMEVPAAPETAMMGGPFGGSPGETAERLRAQVAAQRAADYSATTAWNASLVMNKQTADVSVSISSDTENRAAYVDELESRGVNASADVRMRLNAGIDGDRVVVTGRADTEREGLYDEVLSTYNETLIRAADDPERVTSVFESIRAASFQRARMDLNVTERRVSVEGAVSVENGSALSEAIPGPYSDVDATYTTGNRTVVRLEGAIDGDVTESAVRELSLVDEETAVHLPDDSDPDFESMNTGDVEDYLGFDDESDDSGGFPTMLIAGGAVAVTAAAGGGLLLFSRFG